MGVLSLSCSDSDHEEAVNYPTHPCWGWMTAHTYPLGDLYHITRLSGTIVPSHSYMQAQVLYSKDGGKYILLATITLGLKASATAFDLDLEDSNIFGRYVQIKAVGTGTYIDGSRVDVENDSIATVLTLSSPSEDPITQGTSVIVAGYLRSSGVVPVVGKTISIYAAGTDYENRAHVGDATTDSNGYFGLTVPGSYFSAISTDVLNPALVGAIFFGDASYITSEDEVYFLVESESPCPDGIDANECDATTGCTLGTFLCENGTRYMCKQKKDCTTCYVIVGECDEQMGTALTIEPSDTTPCQGDTITIGGYLTDSYGNPLSGAPIRIMYGQDVSMNYSLGTVYTDADGYYSKAVAVSLMQTYGFKAFYDGDSEYFSSTALVMVTVSDCSTPVCTEGEYDELYSCWNGSVIYKKVCSGNAWVDSGQTCPTKVCTEGNTKCVDYEGYECVDNAWSPTGEECYGDGLIFGIDPIYLIAGSLVVVGVVGAVLISRR